MKSLKHKFIELIPERLEDDILYISIEHCVAIHKCACGCGKEVVTPISPDGWKMIFDGESVTLNPSIGNWNFECRSHYWVRNNQIVHARSWDDNVKPTKKKKTKKGKKFFSFWK
jgi:hypothetical protein